MTDLRTLLDQRYSCRQFRAESVPRATIEGVLDAAQRTPSWCNTQPWRVIVTEGAGTDEFRDALFAHVTSGAADAPDIAFPARYVGAAKARRQESGFGLYSALGITRDDHGARLTQMARNFTLFDAPHVAIVTADATLGTYGVLDCGLYVQTFLLAAQEAGLATIPQAALAGYSGFIRTYFDIPESRVVVCGVSFGYPDESHPANGFRTSRAPLAETVDWR